MKTLGIAQEELQDCCITTTKKYPDLHIVLRNISGGEEAPLKASAITLHRVMLRMRSIRIFT